jgi:hypothetical protein
MYEIAQKRDRMKKINSDKPIVKKNQKDIET